MFDGRFLKAPAHSPLQPQRNLTVFMIDLLDAMLSGLIVGVFVALIVWAAEKGGYQRQYDFTHWASCLFFFCLIGALYSVLASWLGFYGGYVITALATAFVQVATFAAFDIIRKWRHKRKMMRYATAPDAESSPTRSVREDTFRAFPGDKR